MEEIERRLLEQKLQWQQQQSAADARWLQAEEQNMVRCRGRRRRGGRGG